LGVPLAKQPPLLALRPLKPDETFECGASIGQTKAIWVSDAGIGPHLRGQRPGDGRAPRQLPCRSVGLGLGSSPLTDGERPVRQVRRTADRKCPERTHNRAHKRRWNFVCLILLTEAPKLKVSLLTHTPARCTPHTRSLQEHPWRFSRARGTPVE
jgi:hypothetical protein